jgi:SAM-dependent methyltransferase
MGVESFSEKSDGSTISELSNLPSLGFPESIVSQLLVSNFTPPRYVADLACGLGTASIFFAKKWECKVIGIDICQEFILEAHKRSMAAGVSQCATYILADLRLGIPLKMKLFDLVIASAVGGIFDSLNLLLSQIEISAPIDAPKVLWVESISHNGQAGQIATRSGWEIENKINQERDVYIVNKGRTYTKVTTRVLLCAKTSTS